MNVSIASIDEMKQSSFILLLNCTRLVDNMEVFSLIECLLLINCMKKKISEGGTREKRMQWEENIMFESNFN